MSESPAANDARPLAAISPDPFLTEGQRRALDAALSEKIKEKNLQAYVKESKAAAAAATRDGRDSLHVGRGGKDGDRKSRMAKGDGRAKKGGSGGKYVWGGIMDEAENAEDFAIDHNDPNYDSSEEQLVFFGSASAVNLSIFKTAVVMVVEEYFNSGDVPEASRCLSELSMPQYMHWFVKHTVRTAMGRKDREREMTSVLLSSLFGDQVTPETVVKGFEDLLESLDDLVLDVPNAPQLLSLFMSRAIVDDVLPPSFVMQISSDTNAHSAEVRRTCEGHLAARHAAERLLRCWGSGAGLILDETKASIKGLLAEFKESGDISEARRCLLGLGVPFYHHELVKQAVTLGMEDVANQPVAISLLRQLSESGELTQTQMNKGFMRALDSLDDTELDCPNARQALAEMMQEGRRDGWLDKTLQAVPTTNSEASAGLSAQHVPAFKNKVALVLREYFDSFDRAEVKRSLEELEEPGLMHLFVKKAVMMALDGKHKDREAVSLLLADLCPEVIKEEQMKMGFSKLLASAEDIALDVPEAPHMLTLFVGRLIVDDAMPPSFLTSVLPSLEDSSLGVAVVRGAGSMLAARHGAERLQNCWHGSARDVESVRAAMRTLLEEFCSSRDATEASRCLAELATPHYHHELVKQVLVMAMANGDAGPELLSLLQQLCKTGLVSETQLMKGFGRVEAQLDDITMDIPSARNLYSQFKTTAVDGGWLDVSATA